MSGLMSSLNIGASGLEASSTDLSVISDNIANSSTIGFKAGRADFEAALSESLIGSTQQGLGTRLQTVQRILTQGSISATESSTDLAIEGQGMFIVQGTPGQGALYTRDGRFKHNADGYLTTQEGMKVQGYPADKTGSIQATLGGINIDALQSIPFATQNISIKANLNSNQERNLEQTQWDPLNPVNTSHFSNPVRVVDSLGNEHDLSIYYRKSSDGNWDYHVLTARKAADQNAPMEIQEIGSGTLSFDGMGRLTSDGAQTISFTPAGLNESQTINLNFGKGVNNGGTGLDGITQNASASTMISYDQDGSTAASLSNFTIKSDGVILGTFSNGRSQQLGQVAIANFGAPDKLVQISGNLFHQTPDSGEPAIGVPSSGGRGKIVSNALEQSNVDMAKELVHMITAQRSFQANSKSISTADQLLQELMSLKR